jgi:hypothetical protein
VQTVLPDSEFEELELGGGYNAWIRLDRDSSDYLLGRLARTRFVSGSASANAPSGRSHPRQICSAWKRS